MSAWLCWLITKSRGDTIRSRVNFVGLHDPLANELIWIIGYEDKTALTPLRLVNT